MSKMNDHDLLKIVQSAEMDAVNYNGVYMAMNREFLSRYLCLSYGDEEEGRSQVVATDVQDVVESDMPSLARVFLGAHDILSFEATTSNQKDIAEAEEKTKYINWIIRNQDDSFQVLHGWLKDTEIQKIGVVHFYCDVKKEVKEYEYKGLNEDEVVEIYQEFIDGADDVEILEEDAYENYYKFRVKRTKKRYVIENVPTEDFLVSRNAQSLEKSFLVGRRGLITRGELLAQGYKRDLIDKLPLAGTKNDIANLYNTRFVDQGSMTQPMVIDSWASEEVEYSDLYVNIDYNGDGIVERRRIYRVGDEILENEEFPIVPFAVNSAMLMPNSIIGRSRAELVIQDNRIKTVVTRQMLDNIYNVNNGRVVVNDDETNIDDLLVVRQNGIVRTKNPIPANAVSPLSAPFIGDKTLMVLQYLDMRRSESTGNLLVNQGLDSDKFYNETATRFDGIEEAGTAKIELVARVIAETGFRQLYSGLSTLVSMYQDEPTEIMVLGKPLAIDPRKWRYEHKLISNVGLAAGDDETLVQNMGLILSAQKEMKMNGSMLVDDKKIYNSLKKITNGIGITRVEEYFNDPELPEQMLLAQNEQLMMMVEQLQQQVQNNPLAEAEKVSAQAKLIEAQARQETEMMKLQEQMRQFTEKMKFDYTKLEIEHSVDVPGQGMGSL